MATKFQDSPTGSNPSSPAPEIDTQVPWARHNHTSSTSSLAGASASRRLSSAAGRRGRRRSSTTGPTNMTEYARDLWAKYLVWAQKTWDGYRKLPREQQIAVGAFILLCWVLIIVTVLYSKAFFDWLGPVSKKWRALPGGWLIAFAFIFVTSFPPVILYSTANTVAGFVYGFPLGWPIAASACVIGSLCAFVASRTVLGNYVDRLVGRDPRFVALGQVLRKEGLLYLTAIRFCPLPFSLSNGFLATIPSITPLSFALSTALSTPKLLVHIFIGSRLAILVEQGDSMSTRDKIINWASMAIGGAIGLTVGFVIYRQTMARAAAISREQNQGAAEEGDAGYSYADAENDTAALLDPEDAAALMSEDDLSMWGDQDHDDWGDGDDDDQHHHKNGKP